MKIFSITFEAKQRLAYRLSDNSLVKLIADEQFSGPNAMLNLIQSGISKNAVLDLQVEREIDLGDVHINAPIPRPMRNIWCVGRNYHEHAQELSASVFRDNKTGEMDWPIVFTKVPECVVGPYDNVRLPDSQISTQIDYESELAIIVGRQGKNITASNAFDYIWGYTIINDVTARDIQMRHKQWDMGKSFDDFCPMGPCIVTADALPQGKTTVSGFVNGQARQHAHTDNMIFSLAEIIETISRGITLYPGDIIATGTPAGVGMGLNPPQFLGKGDVVRIAVEGIGVIENHFI